MKLSGNSKNLLNTTKLVKTQENSSNNHFKNSSISNYNNKVLTKNRLDLSKTKNSTAIINTESNKSTNKYDSNILSPISNSPSRLPNNLKLKYDNTAVVSKNSFKKQSNETILDQKNNYFYLKKTQYGDLKINTKDKTQEKILKKNIHEISMPKNGLEEFTKTPKIISPLNNSNFENLQKKQKESSKIDYSNVHKNFKEFKSNYFSPNKTQQSKLSVTTNTMNIINNTELTNINNVVEDDKNKIVNLKNKSTMKSLNTKIKLASNYQSKNILTSKDKFKKEKNMTCISETQIKYLLSNIFN